MQKTLREIVFANLKNGTAIGHFNFPNFEVAEAIVEAAKEMDLPVILGLSESERAYVGLHEAVSWVKTKNLDLESEGKKTRIYLNADHTYSYDKVVEAIDAGFDMVIYDDAGGDIEKNIEVARKCRKYIDEHNKKNSTLVLFEAELGYIGKGSEVRTDLPDGIQKTTPSDALRFVKSVKPDLLAPAIGNVHGMLKDVPDPKLDDRLCREIFDTTKVPLVLHGASGNSKEDIQACIRSGVVIVHVSTEIRVVYKNALKHAVEGKDLAAYKYLAPVREDVKKLIEEKLRIFTFQ